MSKTILVVEDEADLASLLQEILEMEGYHILAAQNKRQALDLWDKNKNKIDLLLTDVCIEQGETGTALAQTLRAEKPGLKVIFSSGHVYQTALEKFQLPPDSAYLQKPFQFETLFETVKSSG